MEPTLDPATTPDVVAEPQPQPQSQPKRPGGGLAHKLWTGQVSYDFVGRRKIWYALSVTMLVLCLVGLAWRGLDLGIEFSGGSRFQVSVPVTDQTVADFRAAVEDSGVSDLDPTVTTIGSGQVSVETRSLNVDEQVAIRAAIGRAAGVEAEDVAYDQIGASWGKQVTQKAIIALVVFVVLVFALIGLYFRHWKMALSAIVCLLHDLVVTVGVYALVGFSVTPATLTGVLTILGYSLYDTVVVFDKVRENWAELEDSRLTHAEAANLADNQVLMRSINTTVIGVLPVAALLFAGALVLGSGPLEDIGLALFVGMLVGAYSSIFIATPLLSQLTDLDPKVKEHDDRVRRRRAKAKLVPAAVTVETISLTLPDQASSDQTSSNQASPAAQATSSPAANAAQRRTHQSRAQRKKK